MLLESDNSDLWTLTSSSKTNLELPTPNSITTFETIRTLLADIHNLLQSPLLFDFCLQHILHPSNFDTTKYGGNRFSKQIALKLCWVMSIQLDMRWSVRRAFWSHQHTREFTECNCGLVWYVQMGLKELSIYFTHFFDEFISIQSNLTLKLPTFYILTFPTSISSKLT